MFKTIATSLLVLSIFILSGCNSTSEGIKVEAHTAEKVNLDGYKTFAWFVKADLVIDENSSFKRRGYDVMAYVNSQITKQLLNKERTEVFENPDFIVSSVVGVNMDALKEQVDDEGKEYIENIPQAGIVVVMIDPKARKVIWAGGAEADVNQNATDESSKKRIDYAITKMFTKF